MMLFVIPGEAQRKCEIRRIDPASSPS